MSSFNLGSSALRTESDGLRGLLESDTIEREIPWSGGSTYFKAKTADGLYCDNAFRDDRFAIGFAFQPPGSEMYWRLEGRQVLDKQSRSVDDLRHMVVLPAGCEFHGTSVGKGECLWLFIDNREFASDSEKGAFWRQEKVDRTWADDRLAWLLVSRIRSACREHSEDDPLYVESLSRALVCELLQNASRSRPSGAAKIALSSVQVRMLTEYLDANLHRNVSLSELSELVALTPSHFCRAFKQATGQPPHRFQVERRVERAKSLLQKSQLPLADVAVSLGFTSQSHLNNHFRKIVGTTPGRYRARQSSP